MYSCGIIGHRTYHNVLLLDKLLEDLILNHKVNCFNFGTKSVFTLACAKCIERLQKNTLIF